MKVPLPVALIKRMDQAIVDGRAGLESRAEFIREACEGLLADLSYPPAPPEPLSEGQADEPRGKGVRLDSPVAPAPDALPHMLLEGLPADELRGLQISDLAQTALHAPPRGAVVDEGIADALDGPLLGLHNRDYPSVWAAHRLATYTQEDLVPFHAFRERVTKAAWVFADALQRLEARRKGGRLHAMFPSNPRKREAAERGFQAFAIGSVPRRLPKGASKVQVSGPLFSWGVCQLVMLDGELMIGLTSAGWTLLEDLEGLSLILPHSAGEARTFLRHLHRCSPGDLWGFEVLMGAAENEVTRVELVELIEERGARWASADRWSPATTSSIAQGYIARAREWGLLDPGMRDGRYRLTDFGGDVLQDIRTDGEGAHRD